jgi:hypothetical protein
MTSSDRTLNVSCVCQQLHTSALPSIRSNSWYVALMHAFDVARYADPASLTFGQTVGLHEM